MIISSRLRCLEAIWNGKEDKRREEMDDEGTREKDNKMQKHWKVIKQNNYSRGNRRRRRSKT